ncbi:type II secretion system GspH family protein [Candidatus Parcubacteria bacterium]|nr:type II secretion system GspH family protein [Candidatus Parcubacteria bacterium]
MRTIKNTDGFTLVELMVAIVISAIFAASISGLITTNARLAQRGRDLAASNSFAEDKIESFRSLGYLGLGLGTSNITSELPSELNTPRSASVDITQHSTSVKKVYLTIDYSDQGQTRTLNYTTLVGELGVGQY